jgi:hypothetical protein
MRSQSVEVFSDQPNAAVMRHPGRRFPGILFQGDSLHTLCNIADDACNQVGRGSPGYDEVNELRNLLWSSLTHYKTVLMENGIPLPFSED